MREPPFERPERLDVLAEDFRPLLEDDFAEDLPRELLEPLLADEDFDRPDDLDFTPSLLEDFPEDLRVALEPEDLREGPDERALADDFPLLFDLFDSKVAERADFFLDDFWLLTALFESPDRLDEPPDLYTFLDEPEDDFDLTPEDFLERDFLYGFRRLLSEVELFDFLTACLFEFFTRSLDLSETRYDFFDPNPRTGPSFVVARTEFFPDFLDKVLPEPLAEAITRGLYFLLILTPG